MMPTHVRIYFASGRVKVFTAAEFADLTSAWLIGARFQWLTTAGPLEGAGRS